MDTFYWSQKTSRPLNKTSCCYQEECDSSEDCIVLDVCDLLAGVERYIGLGLVSSRENVTNRAACD